MAWTPALIEITATFIADATSFLNFLRAFPLAELTPALSSYLSLSAISQVYTQWPSIHIVHFHFSPSTIEHLRMVLALNPCVIIDSPVRTLGDIECIEFLYSAITSITIAFKVRTMSTTSCCKIRDCIQAWPKLKALTFYALPQFPLYLTRRRSLSNEEGTSDMMILLESITNPSLTEFRFFNCRGQYTIESYSAFLPSLLQWLERGTCEALELKGMTTWHFYFDEKSEKYIHEAICAALSNCHSLRELRIDYENRQTFQKENQLPCSLETFEYIENEHFEDWPRIMSDCAYVMENANNLKHLRYGDIHGLIAIPSMAPILSRLLSLSTQAVSFIQVSSKEFPALERLELLALHQPNLFAQVLKALPQYPKLKHFAYDEFPPLEVYDFQQVLGLQAKLPSLESLDIPMKCGNLCDMSSIAPALALAATRLRRIGLRGIGSIESRLKLIKDLSIVDNGSYYIRLDPSSFDHYNMDDSFVCTQSIENVGLLWPSEKRACVIYV